MIDGIPKNTGNSYLIKGVSLPDSYAAFKSAVEAGTQGLDLNFNSSGWQTVGTLLSKANLLSDTTAEAVKAFAGLSSRPSTVNAALAAFAGVSGVKLVTGTYTGTGTYGSSNPCTLTFDFVPKLLMLTSSVTSSGDYSPKMNIDIRYGTMVDFENIPTSYTWGLGFGDRGFNTLYGKRDGNTFYWYHTKDAASQYNVSGETYHYLAIG